jgi:pimeloyl-ACP methyl ester carboxylesterase
VFAEQEVRASDGLRLYYRKYPGDPQRTAVLCLPGLTRNSRDFEALAPHISSVSRRSVVALDLRGRGHSASDPEWRNYRPEIYVRDVLAVLDAAGLQRVIVIGTSLGGIVGMLLASLHRTRTAGLVLNDIGPALEVAGMLRIASSAGTARTVTTWTEAAADARAANAAVYPEFTDADWMTFARRVYREDSPGRIIRDVDPNVGRAVREPAGVPTGAVPDFWGAFDALDGLPLLCLRGELSDLLSAATVARMAERHAGMKSIEIPRRGHAPTLDEPESRAAIDAFIKQL